MIDTAKETSNELGKLDGLTKEEADSAATEAPAVAQATSTADSLAAALKGENKTQTADLAQIKKEHPDVYKRQRQYFPPMTA